MCSNLNTDLRESQESDQCFCWRRDRQQYVLLANQTGHRNNLARGLSAGSLRSFDLTEVTKYNFDRLCSRECMISALVSSRLCDYVSHQLRANCQCNEVLFRVCLFFSLLFCPWQRVVSGQSAQQTDADGCFEMISEEEARKHLIDSHHFPPHNISWPPKGCLRQRGWMFKFKWM